MIETQILQEITTYFFIAIPGVPCPAKNQDLYGNDIHSQVVGTWDKCGEYFEESNFSRECKSYVKQIHGQFTSLFWINNVNKIILWKPVISNIFSIHIISIM